MKTISLQSLVSSVQANPNLILVEALPEHYFKQGHLSGAVNINVEEVKTKAPQLLPDLQANIVVYCASATCTNSDQVAVQLHSLGYTDVSVFKGGKAEWEASGYSLTPKAT
ncbi:MAG TPA: rhodanese-like domain-containing protein [Opitutaceae bacterium]|nr:rhodanese-like domain-containing protein [Opitutaceae bacterium]